MPPIGSNEYFKELTFRRKHRKYAIRNVLKTLPEFNIDSEEITKVDFPTKYSFASRAVDSWQSAPAYMHWLIYTIAALTPIIIALIEVFKNG